MHKTVGKDAEENEAAIIKDARVVLSDLKVTIANRSLLKIAEKGLNVTHAKKKLVLDALSPLTEAEKTKVVSGIMTWTAGFTST